MRGFILKHSFFPACPPFFSVTSSNVSTSEHLPPVCISSKHILLYPDLAGSLRMGEGEEPLPAGWQEKTPAWHVRKTSRQCPCPESHEHPEGKARPVLSKADEGLYRYDWTKRSPSSCSIIWGHFSWLLIGFVIVLDICCFCLPAGFLLLSELFSVLGGIGITPATGWSSSFILM